MRKKTTLQTKSDINHFNPSSRTPPTAKGGNNPPFAVGGGRTRLPHSPTAKGGPTLHGGWAYLHGVQSPISPQLKTNLPPPPAVFSCGNRNVTSCISWPPPASLYFLICALPCETVETCNAGWYKTDLAQDHTFINFSPCRQISLLLSASQRNQQE